MPKNRKKYDDEKAMKQWLGADYADDFEQADQSPPVQQQITAASIGRKILSAHIDTLATACRASADNLGLAVRDTPSLLGMRYSGLFPLERGRTLVAAVMDTAGYNEDFSNSQLTAPGVVYCHAYPERSSAVVKLKIIDPTHGDLYNERALFKQAVNPTENPSRNYLASFTVKIAQDEGPGIDEFLSQTAEIRDDLQDTLVCLGRFGLIEMDDSPLR